MRSSRVKTLPRSRIRCMRRSYSFCVRSTGSPDFVTENVDGSMVSAPAVRSVPTEALAFKSRLLLRMFARTRAISSRIEKGFVI